MKNLSITLLLLSVFILAQGQGSTQVISGTVIDKETQLPIQGATVYVKDSDPMIGTITDQYGKYKLTKNTYRQTGSCLYISGLFKVQQRGISYHFS